MVLSNNIVKGIEDLIDASSEQIGDDLSAIFMFGSGNNSDFIDGISDLDFLYILRSIDSVILSKIGFLRSKASQMTECKVDIKPFSLIEFKAGLQGIGSFEFFTGWGLEMMRKGEQKCLYNNGDVSLDYNVDPQRIKSDALERAHYYITKLRKMQSSNDEILLRGIRTKPDNIERLKLYSSAIKNVLTFCLAYRGAVVNKLESVLELSECEFGDISEIKKLFENKKSLLYLDSVLTGAYDKVERLYASVIDANSGALKNE